VAAGAAPNGDVPAAGVPNVDPAGCAPKAANVAAVIAGEE